MNKIPYEKRAQVYAMALDKFGAEMQLVVAIEEMSEVQKEICKAIRGEVCAVMDAKVERLRQRIEQS